MKDRIKLPVSVLVSVLAGSCFLYLAALTPDRFGFYHDDGIYVVTGKALATGKGYHIISLPYEPAQTKYPPFYPFLLSLIWRLYPHLPENLFPMMLLSVAATLAFLALAWNYLVKSGYACRWMAVVIVVLAAINWRTVILATGIYSEMVFAALSVAALWLAEIYEKKPSSRILGISLGVILGLAFLTRTSAVTLLIAVVLYFLLRKHVAKAYLVVTVGSLFILAWITWRYLNGTTVDSITAPFYTSYLADFSERVKNLRELLSVLGTNAFMLVFVSIPVVFLGLTYVQTESSLEVSLIAISLTFLLFGAGFVRDSAGGMRLVHVYLFTYLLFHLFWPYTTYDRFLMPIVPFLLLFLMTELKVLIGLVQNNLTSARQSIKKISAGIVGSVVFLCVGTGAYNYVSGIYGLFGSKAIYAERASEDAGAIQWINTHTAPSEVLLSYRDPVYYLYTGRKAIRSFWVKERVSGRGQSSEQVKIVFRIIKESHGRYLIVTSSDFDLESQPDLWRKTFKSLLQQQPHIFVPVFKCGDECTIYRIQASF